MESDECRLEQLGGLVQLPDVATLIGIGDALGVPCWESQNEVNFLGAALLVTPHMRWHFAPDIN